MPRRPRLPPLLAEFDDEEREAVLAANRAFYRAFAERDVAGMDQIWAQTGAMVCLHPGQAPLHGRTEIMAINGEIVRRGAQYGIATPVNAELVRRIQAEERPQMNTENHR